MRANVLEAFGQPLALRDLPVPPPNSDQILVRIRASGVCHTDVHAVDGDWPARPRLPLIPGHEGVGEVAAVGREVRGRREGDRVGVAWLNSACGQCRDCLGGWETLCSAQQNSGYTVAGTHAEYCLVSGAWAVPLPGALAAAEAAPLLCAGVTTYKGLKQTDARPGEWVVIYGVGGTGHLAVQYARAMGLSVVAVDLDDAKLELARGLGAELLVNATAGLPLGKIRRLTGGAHAALVTAVSLRAIEQALGCLRRGGTCVVIGIPPGTFQVSGFDLVANALTLRGSIVGTRCDLLEALDFAASGLVRATVTTRPLEEVNPVLDELRKGSVVGRVVLDVT